MEGDNIKGSQKEAKEEKTRGRRARKTSIRPNASGREGRRRREEPVRWGRQLGAWLQSPTSVLLHLCSGVFWVGLGVKSPEGNQDAEPQGNRATHALGGGELMRSVAGRGLSEGGSVGPDGTGRQFMFSERSRFHQQQRPRWETLPWEVRAAPVHELGKPHARPSKPRNV